MASGHAEPYGKEGLSLEEARRHVLKTITLLDQPIALPLNQTLNRVSAEAVIATEAVPGFRASIMDGYALGQARQPKIGDRWTIQGDSAPGAPFHKPLGEGEAIRILTGAPVPDGAGRVLPQELVEADGRQLKLMQPPPEATWIRSAHEECAPGEILMTSGVRLSAARIGRLAACGIATMKVQRKARIGLLISGDELVPIGTPRQAGDIWESNGTLLEALLANLNQSVHERRVVSDQPASLKQALQELANTCDVVVSTGGVSAGTSDWIRPLVDELGKVSFWKLFLKPGRPFAFGNLGKRVPFFGLPGNPVAAAVTALQLLWPALQQMEGQASPEIFPRLKVELADPFPRRPGRPELARARLMVNDYGSLLACVNGSQASSRIGSLEDADLLLEIPADAETLEPGTLLWAQLLRRSVF